MLGGMAEGCAVAVAILAYRVVALDVAVLVVDMEESALGAGDVCGYAWDGGDIVLSTRRCVEPSYSGAVSTRCTASFERCATVVHY